MEQVLYQLPEGWEWIQLGKVLDVRDGTHDSPKYVESGYPLITSKNITGKGLDVQNVKFISQEDFDAINKRSKVDVGDILFAMIGTIGFPTVVTDEPNYAIKNIALFKKRQSNQNMDFFRHFLESPYAIESMLSQAKGAAQKFVGLKVLRNFYAPLPPVLEQKRIVEKLDAVLTRIDTAIEHLQESIKLADAFFKSILSSLVCSESIEHEKLSLEELGSFSGGGTPSKNKSEFWNGEILWITPKDMKSPVITNSELKITQEGVRGSSAKFIPPRSVLIVARSGILRHTLPVCINENECTVNQDIKVFIPNEKISSEYVQHMLKGYESFILSELVKGGVTVESLKYNDFQNFKFSIPSIEEQKRIVEQLSQVRKLTDPLKEELCIKIKYLQQLKASILDSAFKGEL
ncbi:restriction endonuclease subunit S [Acinetobacter dispersus]|uniref:restriction endonuclease subunit S n=1 Tax=Acinetobacter dispersus TaxID=70348 RepID=UPI001F4B2FB0|nr:restriction endonuclease subunit S [Acinetobacter dispersus]MCH7390358.1 restriction endonuclease subunit S [Acinetobacter dispersus]